MRRTSGQQMLQWGSIRPARAVGIDLTEAGRETPPPTGGRLAERLDEKAVPSECVAALAHAPAGRGVEVAQHSATPRFHLDRLSRELVVDEIISINPTASVRFLSEFGDDGLRLYLGRLRSAQLGRGRASMADRPAGPGVTCAHGRRF